MNTPMTEENFKKFVQMFFDAIEKRTMLVIIDSASKNEKAVFSLVSFTEGKIISYSALLRELGFKNYRQQRDLFVTCCSGRFSLYILDNIGNKLCNRGIEPPKSFYELIDYQRCI